TCTVVTYDAVKQRVKLNDGWGYTRTFAVKDVWQGPPRKAGLHGDRTRMYVTLIGAGAGLGAVIGSIITALVMR
ncbi:MAG: hypothetical protein M3O61_19075, partial [Gemmatimonadota bacterium]|nr:hypothetical protein [Gemmatimonadota bacterium]